MTTKKLQDLRIRKRIGFFIVAFGSFWIAIRLMPSINEFVLRQGFASNPLVNEGITIFVTYFLATFAFPILGAIILLWLILNFKR